ncbi:hypothetical protein IP91_03914 [Pseudoduganella lurida]|uniref:Restriction endonuclease type IV Mrr domain-containing protein n=1 Tax=Pseudoduganella lurida TaxID=1036180 RepID=A0A562R2M1_9BURK|nr:hypothetical protein [Pseudoduganella lurida]TWI63073.1 hypothetical protein IP91_03914 [Pseudoduganella lurida]
MTSTSTSPYLRSATWQDLERLSLALLSAEYGAKFRRWGGAGQRKDGIDAWAKLPDGRIVAARFEGREARFGQPLTDADIDSALAEVAAFPHPIDELLILTTASNDAGMVSTARAPAKEVKVWGWQSIGARIDRHPAIQKKFFGIGGKPPVGARLALGVAAVLIVAGGAGSLFLSKSAMDNSQRIQQDAPQTIAAIAANVAALDKTYEGCLAAFDQHVFTPGPALSASCRDTATRQLTTLTKQVDKARNGLPPDVQTELSRMMVIFNEDVREASVVTSSTYAFAKAVAEGTDEACVPASSSALEKAGDEAMTAQLRYYFLLRDFIRPEMDAARTILALHARAIKEPVQNEMAAAAQRMEQVLVERTKYDLKNVARPFSLSAEKKTASPGATPGDDAAEAARWRNVLASACRTVPGKR